MKKICLIDYPYYFIPLAESLMNNGHEVYWITSRKSTLKRVSKRLDKSKILYLNTSDLVVSTNLIDIELI